MNYQSSPHTPTIQWSAIPENQHRQMSQQLPSSQHQSAPHRFSSSATSLSLPQVSCSVMQLQSYTCPRAPPVTRSSPTQHHTQYTHNAHLLLEHPVIEPETPTTHPWQTVKKRKRTHLPMETTTRGRQSPFNSPNQFEELSHLSDDDTQTPASVPHETTSSEHSTQPRVHKRPRYMLRGYKLSWHGEIRYWNLGGRTIVL